MVRFEGTVRLKYKVLVDMENLKNITTARAYLEKLIQLHQKYPHPYRVWQATKFNPKSGEAVAFGWRTTNYGANLFLTVYTHPGFCQDLPRSQEVDKELERITRSGKTYAIAGFSVSAFTSSYNGGAAVAGLQISPMHRPEEL